VYIYIIINVFTTIVEVQSVYSPWCVGLQGAESTLALPRSPSATCLCPLCQSQGSAGRHRPRPTPSHTQPPLPHGTSPPASLPLTTTAPSTADTATLHTHRQTHTQTLILLHTQPPLPCGKDVYFCWDEITYSIEKRIVLQIYEKFQGPIIPIFVEISSNLLISGVLLK